jgi:RNA recognition motif-containing protein
MKIFVGNLSYQVTEDELRQEFAAHGTVSSVSIASDRYDNRPKGFAFVEMPAKSEAETAIASLNGKMLGEKALTVNEARPKSDSKGSFGSRQGGRSGGGSGGGNRGRSNRY